MASGVVDNLKQLCVESGASGVSGAGIPLGNGALADRQALSRSEFACCGSFKQMDMLLLHTTWLPLSKAQTDSAPGQTDPPTWTFKQQPVRLNLLSSNKSYLSWHAIFLFFFSLAKEAPAAAAPAGRGPSPPQTLFLWSLSSVGVT